MATLAPQLDPPNPAQEPGWLVKYQEELSAAIKKEYNEADYAHAVFRGKPNEPSRVKITLKPEEQTELKPEEIKSRVKEIAQKIYQDGNYAGNSLGAKHKD